MVVSWLGTSPDIADALHEVAFEQTVASGADVHRIARDDRRRHRDVHDGRMPQDISVLHVERHELMREGRKQQRVAGERESAVDVAFRVVRPVLRNRVLREDRIAIGRLLIRRP